MARWAVRYDLYYDEILDVAESITCGLRRAGFCKMYRRLKAREGSSAGHYAGEMLKPPRR